MAKVKCGYCGEYYDEMYEGHLENGSNCCPRCEEAEDQKRKETSAETEVKK